MKEPRQLTMRCNQPRPFAGEAFLIVNPLVIPARRLILSR